MTRDKAAGMALIAGAIAGLVTMALHPTGHDLARAVGQSPWPARINVLAHSIAIASSPLLLFGAMSLSRRVSDESALAGLALVTYGFSLIAVMVAAIASGFVAPELIAEMAASQGAEREMVHAVLDYNSRVNQAFAKVFVVMSSAAITLWSVAILRARSFPRWIGWLGCVVGGLIILMLLTGSVRLNVHGFGLIVIAQSTWLVVMGSRLAKM